MHPHTHIHIKGLIPLKPHLNFTFKSTALRISYTCWYFIPLNDCIVQELFLGDKTYSYGASSKFPSIRNLVP